MRLQSVWTGVVALLATAIAGCAGGSSTSTQPPPQTITVAVSPASAVVTAGQTQAFTATVTGTSNTSVTWQVNGVAGGDSTNGTISASGVYTAPTNVPSTPTVTVKAISQADTTKNATASVTIQAAPVVSVSINPTSANVTVGQTKAFTPTVTGSSNTAVNWQVNGVAGGNSTVGTISASGVYTAPASVPSPATVTVKVISQADTTKNATASVTVVAAQVVSVSLSPTSASVTTGQTKTFNATVTGASNTAVTWQVNNVAGGNSTFGTISASGVYTAPASVPSPATVTVKAISQADNTKSATASVTVVAPVAVSVSPTSANVTVGQTKTFTATVTGTSNTAVTWQVNNVTGGNSTVGTISASGVYTAPASVPSPASVTVKAVSQADNTKSATASVTVVAAVGVSVSPTSANVTTSQTTTFTATVTGSSNTAVTWQVNNVTGGNSTVGTISASGVYTAPASVPSPATVTVKAISQADNTKSATASVTVVAPVVVISVSPTTATVNVGNTQSFTPTVTGSSNTGVTWQVNNVTGGDSTHGTINTSGLYTAPASVPSPATVTVKAISQADTSKTATATVTISSSSSNVTISITPKRAALTTGQTQNYSATITGNSNTNATWEVDTVPGGNSSVGTIDTNGKYSPPSAAGTHTVTARSAADSTKTANSTVYVTDLAGVYTYHNNVSRDGTNTKELALSPANVTTSTFGKLFSCPVDGAVYAQPLWVANVTIGGVKKNVVVVVTMRDTIYAFDADANPCVTIWSKNLLLSGETYGSYADLNTKDIYQDIGILGTPVIDSSTNAIYFVVKAKTTSNSSYKQRLYGLNLADGSSRTGSPVDLNSSITTPGTGDSGSVCPTGTNVIPFCTQTQNQRAGLALANGTVYVAWASHGDQFPYHGWVMAFSTSNLARTAVFNASPNSGLSGIWMAGGAPAIDSSNNVYVITGNGKYDGATEFGDSVLRLSTSSGLTLADWFTPSNEATLDASDSDLGAGGTVVLIDLPSAPSGKQHLVIGGGKGQSYNGQFYVLNRESLGHKSSDDSQIVQTFLTNGPIFSTPAFWNNRMYIAPFLQPLLSYTLDPSQGKFSTTVTAQSSNTFQFPGATPSISANGTSGGVVWAIDSSAYGVSNYSSAAAGPAILHAYDASNLSELWNSTMGSGNTAGNAVKFTVPTVANGKVYIGTRGNDSSTGSGSVFGQLDVYGLKPN